jgi:hypothetical protein
MDIREIANLMESEQHGAASVVILRPLGQTEWGIDELNDPEYDQYIKIKEHELKLAQMRDDEVPDDIDIFNIDRFGDTDYQSISPMMMDWYDKYRERLESNEERRVVCDAWAQVNDKCTIMGQYPQVSERELLRRGNERLYAPGIREISHSERSKKFAKLPELREIARIWIATLETGHAPEIPEVDIFNVDRFGDVGYRRNKREDPLDNPRFQEYAKTKYPEYYDVITNRHGNWTYMSKDYYRNIWTCNTQNILRIIPRGSF